MADRDEREKALIKEIESLRQRVTEQIGRAHV
jgi:hypothetical protein